MPVTIADIQGAAQRIAGAVPRTPCHFSPLLSQATGMRLHFKLENLQRTGSFKERGARNALLLLPPAEQKRGVVAASAGNHALALAWHGSDLGIPVTVVMPRFAPLTKIANCEKFGARVLLHGSNIAEAREKADQIAASEKLAYINGFNDEAIIAGQGTLGLEILDQVKNVEAVLVPVGGAGLIGGVALAVKSLNPDIAVIAVVSEKAPSFELSMAAGSPVRAELQPTLADGLCVPEVGANGFSLAGSRVDKTVVVSERFIALAILRLLEVEKSVVEGSGAICLGACLAGSLPELRGKNVVIPLTGGNIDTSTLGRILERGLAHDGRLCRVDATISDRPGGLARFAAIIAEEGGSIIEIDHDRAFASDDITKVSVHCVVETRDNKHIETLRKRLWEEGFIAAADQGVEI